MRKRWLMLMARVLSAIIGISVLISLFLLTPQAKNIAFERLRSYLRGRSGIDLQASSIRLDFFRGRATLENPIIRSISAPDLPPIFRAGHIDIDLSILDAIRGYWVIEDLNLTTPQIHYYVGQNGQTNLPGSTTASGPSPNLLILRAQVIDGSFKLENIRHEVSFTLPRWQLFLSGDRGMFAHRIVLTGRQESVIKYQSHTIPINALEFSGTLQKRALQIDRAYLAGAGSSLSIAGSLRNFSMPVIDLRITPNFKLERISSIIGLKEKIRGNVIGTILATGGPGQMQVDAQLRGSDISAIDYERTSFDLRTRAEWIRDSGKLTVHAFDLSSPEGSLSGSAELFPGAESGINSVEARIQNLDLFPIWKQVRAPFDLASRSTGRISLRWRGAFSPSRIAAKTYLKLVATRASPDLNLLPLSGILDAQMQSNRIFGNLTSLAVLGTEVSGQFSLRSFRDVEGNFQGGASSIDILMARLSQFLGIPDYSLVGIRVTGPIQFNAQASGKLKQPNIVASVDAPLLQAGDLKNLRAQADATIEDSQLTFRNTIILPQNSTVFIQGNVGLGGSQTALNLDLNTEKMPVADLLSILRSDVQIGGSLKVSLHVNGTTESLVGYASVKGNELSIYGEQLGHLDMDLRISGREIQSTQFRLVKDPKNPDANRLDARLAYALDSGQFQFHANGKDLILNQLALLEGRPVQGTVNFLASGSGTIAQPSIEIRLESSDIQIWQKSLGPVSVDANLRNEQIALTALVPHFSLSSTAFITNHDPYPFSVTLQARNSDLSLLGLKGVNGERLTGNVDAGLTISGNLKDLAQAHVSAQIQSAHLQAGELEVHTRDPVQLEYRDDSLAIISTASIVSRNSILAITGRIPIRQPAPAGALRLEGQIDLSQATGFVPALNGLAATGILNLNLALAGTPKELQSSGSIVLKDGAVQIARVPARLTDVNIQADIQEGSLVLQRADAAWAEGKVVLTGELPFGLLLRKIPVRLAAKKGAARFALDLTDLRPEATGILPQDIAGHVSLHLAGETTSADLRSLRAQIEFQDLNLKLKDIEFSQKNPSTILVRDGVASISRLSLIGPQTNIEASGSAGLYLNGPLNLQFAGNVDAALLTSTIQDPKVAGKLQVRIVVSGTRNDPRLSGYAEMNGGRLSLRNPRVVADSLNLRLHFSTNEILIQEFAGTLNGGSITAGGTIAYRNGTLNDFNLKARLRDFFLNYPEGLKSVSSGSLDINSSDDSIVVNGNLRATESSYREPIEVGGQLLSYLKSQQVVELDREHDPLLDRIRLNIAVQTTAPLIVQNNIAKVEATANLRLVGTFYEPSIVGRVTLNEGGEIVLNQQEYYINRGLITLANQTYIEPELNIQAQTKVGTNDITLQLTGTPERLATTLTSEPPLSQTEILSLLLTGKTASETQNPGIVRTQALSLIAGQAGEEVAREARQALHLSTFRIEPGLITSESDPGARLTLGEDITRNLSLAYSMNLVNGGDQIWAAQYDIARRLTTQATKQQDNTYRFEFRHDLRLGGPSSRRSTRSAAPSLRIGSIQFQGGAPYTDKNLSDKLGIKPGEKFDFPKVQKGLDRLHDFFADQKRLEAEIRMHRETQQRNVDLKLNIDPGPVVDFSFEGIPISGSVREKVETAWMNGVFDTERFDDAIAAIRRPLIQEGYLQAKVTYTMETDDEQKRIHFQIVPGARYTKAGVAFPGASEISAAELGNALELANLKLDIYADPQKVVDYLKRYYYERGYLQARVELPQLDLDPGTGTGQVLIPVQEGPMFTIGELEFIGNHAFSYDQLWSVIPTSSGSSYDPNTLRDAVKAMTNLYHSKGYNDVTITFRVVQDSATAHANLAFQITERRQSIIRDIAIEGNQGTSKTFVERQLDFQIGDALDFTKLDVTRKRLYATGIYTSVDFQTEELPSSAPDSREKDLRILVRLRETRPYRLQYGFFFDTERGPGGLMEAQNLNVLGRASNLGLRLRYDSDLKEARLYYNQPFVTKIHLKMDASAFVQSETRPYFSANRVGFSIFQEKKLAKEFRLDYGYRYDHVRWDGLPPDPTIFQASVPVARLIGTLTRDTRDSILDATRGEFASHSLEFGPHFLGSEAGFARYSGQYFRYVPLDKFLGWPKKDKAGNPIPPKLIYAGALRLGLTAAFAGKPLISPERFFAGGGTTMRGFEQDRLGPLETLPDGTLRPLGGEGLFLFNNEMRFPIVSILQGVGFLDLGNVYARLSDFNFSLRKSAGLGLRVKVKFVPLRFDYGVKLDRKPGESAGAFFFSIGQAF